jgi:hypothetical protein
MIRVDAIAVDHEDRVRVMGISRPTLHIVFGQSAGGTPGVALRQASRDEKVLSFNDDLSFGPIDPPVPMVRTAITLPLARES